MTDLKFNILKTIYEKYPIREENKSAFLKPEFADPIFVKHAFEELEVKKYIEPMLGSDKYRLSPLGANAFEDAQEERNRVAKGEKQNRFTTALAIVSTTVAVMETLFIIFR